MWPRPAAAFWPPISSAWATPASPTSPTPSTYPARYLDAWFDALGPAQAASPVVHDWGGTLAFDRAARRPRRVRSLAFTETIICALAG
ncbi:hypothetical protein GCM10012280_64370 [Wenjunlia tyrosinilytica]|uniref:Uncharacterized protein n=1 Tax=Wenjunlia tyrosinilytica TaxID=1544741 RepID=A0A918E2C8_9ACTN|nr:hypothetical protein GCM10012280_64370 [Wenjunlia tyrosinilytica]